MNTEFIRILSSKQHERRDLFFATANRLGTTLQNVEKDFWVCLVLDVLFNGRDSNEPRLLFKGGTSLSKAYSLISRFSEDLDITVFREDIGQHIDIENMISLSGKQQRIRLNAIKKDFYYSYFCCKPLNVPTSLFLEKYGFLFQINMC